jgi:hypothetical protein
MECWFTLGDGKKKMKEKREKPNGSIEKKNVINNYALPSIEMESI